jgi:hypothetical protein
MNEPSRDSTLVNGSSVSDGGPPVCAEGMTADPRPSEEPAVIGILLWHKRTLAYFTMYSELCAARTPEDFARVHMSFRREWAFDGGFVSRFIF